MTQADQDADVNRSPGSEEDSQTVGQMFQEHRDRLKLMVRLRMDQRLRGRIDASDVLQEVAPSYCGYRDFALGGPIFSPGFSINSIMRPQSLEK